MTNELFIWIKAHLHYWQYLPGPLVIGPILWSFLTSTREENARAVEAANEHIPGDWNSEASLPATVRPQSTAWLPAPAW